MEQATFDFKDEQTIDARFEVFLAECPDVYPMFCSLAAQLRRAGHERYGAKGIVEVIRFHRATTGRDADGYKINNDYTSRLARKLIAEDPSYEGFFELRTLKSRGVAND